MQVHTIATFLLPFLLGVASDCGAPSCNEIEDYPKGNVVFVAVLFRHGDRAPEKQEVYACDPYKEENEFWPEGFGNLLKKGRQRLYTLGRFLRHRYASLLPPLYHFRDINVTSSDLDRTITSAECILAGLYLPQLYDSDARADIVAPIIPIHTIDKNNDNLIMFKKSCPAYAAELDRLRIDQYKATIDQGLGPVYNFLTRVTCQNISSITAVNRIHTDLLTQAVKGYEPPAWTSSSEYPAQQMEYIAALSFHCRAYTKKQKRLAGGPLLTRIVDGLVSKQNRSMQPDFKMMLFSGHDTTVSIMLQTLGYEKLIKPDFGSSIIFELHRIEGRYYVKVLFKPSGFTNQLIPLPLAECHLPSMCTLEEFVAMSQPWRISTDQWLAECNSNNRD